MTNLSTCMVHEQAYLVCEYFPFIFFPQVHNNETTPRFGSLMTVLSMVSSCRCTHTVALRPMHGKMINFPYILPWYINAGIAYTAQFTADILIFMSHSLPTNVLYMTQNRIHTVFMFYRRTYWVCGIWLGGGIDADVILGNRWRGSSTRSGLCNRSYTLSCHWASKTYRLLVVACWCSIFVMLFLFFTLRLVGYPQPLEPILTPNRMALIDLFCSDMQDAFWKHR